LLFLLAIRIHSSVQSRDTDIAFCPSVCPSVRLSTTTLRYSKCIRSGENWWKPG